MRVLSLFDGISCARVALDRLGVGVSAYYASEIDKYAIQVSKSHWPDIIQVGGVQDIMPSDYKDIDLLIGGSPCQDLSVAKRNRTGLSGDRSGLFWDYVRILKELKPKYFVLENVASMSSNDRDIITHTLGVEPILINANLVSAQNRKRLFWTNIPGIEQPKDLGIVIRDILENINNRKVVDTPNSRITKTGMAWDKSGKGYHSQDQRAYSINGKHPTVPTARTITKVNVLFDDGTVSPLDWVEIERLQGLPDGYTDMITQKEKRGAVLGNAFNVDVIVHILGFMKGVA